MGYRAKLVKFFTFIGGLYFFLEFVLPESIAGVKIDAYHDQISNGLTVIGSMAIGLGIINLFMVHGSKIVFRRKGWLESSSLLAGLLIMTWVTAADWLTSLDFSQKSAEILNLREFADQIEKDFQAKKEGVPEAWFRNLKLKEALGPKLQEVEQELNAKQAIPLSEDHPDTKLFAVARRDLNTAAGATQQALGKLSVTKTDTPDFAANKELAVALSNLGSAQREFTQLAYKHTPQKQLYELLYQSFFVSLGAAMFSLLGFYIAAAAYRAFRIKSAESALMMGAALIVMLGQIPFGIWLWESFPDLRLWLLSVPSSGAFRAIKIGAAVAGLVMAFRMWFSIESESFAERSQ